MKISPCGWYCIEEPEDWICHDTPGSIRLSSPDGRSRIEISSARKEEVITDVDIWELRDESAKEIVLPQNETSAYSHPHKPIECVQTVFNDTANVICLVFAFWGHYCVSLQLFTTTATLEETAPVFRNVVESLQSMTID